MSRGHNSSTFPCIPIMSVCPCRPLWFYGCDLLQLLELSGGWQRNASDPKPAVLGIKVSLGGLGLKLEHVSSQVQTYIERICFYIASLPSSAGTMKRG